MISIYKKIYIILTLILLFNLFSPLIALASTPTPPKKDCPPSYVGETKYFYFSGTTLNKCDNGISKEVEKKDKSPKRKVNPNPYIFGVSAVSSYILSQSDYAKDLEEKFWDKVDDIDQGLDTKLRQNGINGWDDIFESTYNGYSKIKDSVLDLIRNELPYLDPVIEIHSDVDIHPFALNLIDQFYQDQTSNDRIVRTSGVMFREVNNKIEMFIAIYGFRTGYESRGGFYRMNISFEISNHLRYRSDFHDNGLDVEHWQETVSYARSLSNASMYSYYLQDGKQIPDLLFGDSINLPSHLPDLTSDHFTNLPDKTLYNPNDYKIVEVDGSPHIEIDYRPNGDHAEVPPYLIPIDNPNETALPVYPNPIPDPNPNPNPDPDPNPDPNPNPDPDPNPEDELVPPPEPLPDGGKTCGSLDLELESIELFTQKFPFSLPWDIFNAIEALFGQIGSNNPEFVFVIFDTEIDIKIPDFILNSKGFLHSILIIIFDVSIIYALHRLFGGAS